MAKPIISDCDNTIDQLTKQVQPTQTLPLPIQTQAPQRSLGFMDFTSLEAAIKACDLIAQSNFCPAAFRGRPGDVLCAIQYGMEIGYSPMQALQSIAVINGKPSVYGDGLLALCQSFSECEDIKEEFDAKTMIATCIVKRKGRSPVIHQWDVARATKANLWDKAGPWKQYPERMLQMRARGFALRDAFADRLKGIITAEEARDYPVQDEKALKLVTPIRKEIEIQEPAAKEQTIKQLQFLVNRLVQQNPKSQVVVDKWLKKANVDNLDKLNERQAQACIKKIEDEDSTARREWTLHKRAEKICKDAVESMPHGFYDDFSEEQLQGAVNHG